MCVCVCVCVWGIEGCDKGGVKSRQRHRSLESKDVWLVSLGGAFISRPGTGASVCLLTLCVSNNSWAFVRLRVPLDVSRAFVIMCVSLCVCVYVCACACVGRK